MKNSAFRFETINKVEQQVLSSINAEFWFSILNLLKVTFLSRGVGEGRREVGGGEPKGPSVQT